MKLVKTIGAFALLGVIATSCGEKKTAESTDMADTTTVVVDTMAVAETPNIVGVASGNADFSTLVTAVKAAGLVETLSGDGPFTVFAPNNAAFDKLPAGTVDDLLKPEKADALSDILGYHTYVGVIKEENMTDGQSLGMVNGKNIKITMVDGKPVINGKAKIVAVVPASNGIVYAIDEVLLPE